MSATLHTWEIWRSWPDVTVMTCHGCDAKLELQSHEVPVDFESAAIHGAAKQGMPGTCEEMIVKKVMER